MKPSCRSKVVLVALLAISLVATGCSPQWISIALADLPVLLQMALNIGTTVTTLESGQQLSAAEAAAIQNISTEASKDLNLLQSLYNDYKTTANVASMQKIQNVIADINTNLPALLQSAHIRDAALAARISAAVNLIVTTVNSFASLIPAQGATPAQMKSKKAGYLPHAKDLKNRWNQEVCSPGETIPLLAGCSLK